MRIEIAELRALRLEPGMRLVVRVRGRITAQHAESVRAVVRDWAGGAFPVLVVDDSFSLEAVDAREIAP